MCQRKNNAARVLGAVALLVLAAGFSAGCTYMPGRVTPFRPPADVAHLRLERQNSARIAVDKVWLERNEQGLAVTGYVMPADLSVTDTMGS
jgi:hypothetical protein